MAEKCPKCGSSHTKLANYDKLAQHLSTEQMATLNSTGYLCLPPYFPLPWWLKFLSWLFRRGGRNNPVIYCSDCHTFSKK